jgi:hypothetical protein
MSSNFEAVSSRDIFFSLINATDFVDTLYVISIVWRWSDNLTYELMCLEFKFLQVFGEDTKYIFFFSTLIFILYFCIF